MPWCDFEPVIQVARAEALRLHETGEDSYSATSSRFTRVDEHHARHLHPRFDEQKITSGSARPSWPNQASFAVCLTHDVDYVAWHQPQMHWRQLRNHLWPSLVRPDRRTLGGLRSAAVEWGRSLTKRSQADPLCCYERWLEVERSVGARSTFLFLAEKTGRPHQSDGTYHYHDQVLFDGQSCTVAEMMREIHTRGWEVGLHASWRSFNCLSEMQRQKEQVERAIDAPIVSVRHHYLHFDIRCTPRVQSQAGFQVDSSLGFNDSIGFRHGTSYPWFLSDFDRDEALSLLELPLVIQDKCLLRMIAGGNRMLAVKKAEEMADRVESVGGVLTLLWHPCTIRKPIYFETYRDILLMLKARNSWFGTMEEVASWWRRS